MPGTPASCGCRSGTGGATLHDMSIVVSVPSQQLLDDVAAERLVEEITRLLLPYLLG